MAISRFAPALTLACLVLAAHGSAHAQFGYQLPKDDFIWKWGDAELGDRFEDFDVNGAEGGFTCELKGRMRPGSQMSRTDINQMQNEIRTRMDFIYYTANLMNQLDLSRELDWALLTCTKYKAEPSTAEEKAEHEARARERMQREIERRRARAQQDQRD